MYAITHEDKAFTPSGRIDLPVSDVANANRETEQKEIEWLKTAPDKVFLYAKNPIVEASAMQRASGSYSVGEWRITTWLGTPVATHVWVGGKANVGFGFRTHRRAVDCRIFGVRYIGWYMESSGDYCRLRKAKRQ